MWYFLIPIAVGIVVVAGLLWLRRSVGGLGDLLLDSVGPTRRVWGVTRTMIVEALRTRIARVSIVLLLAMLPAMGVSLEGDGTLPGRAQNFLTYALGVTAFLLSLMTVFLSFRTLAGEISDRRIHTIVTKPIPRWQFLLGKWLGLLTVNVALLAVAGVLVYGFLRYQASRPTVRERAAIARMRPAGASPEEIEALLARNPQRKELFNEVLVARAGVRPVPPDFAAAIRERLDVLRSEQRIPPDMDEAQRQKLIADIRKEFVGQWQNIPHGGRRGYVFEGVDLDRSEGQSIQFRFKPKANPTPPSNSVHAALLIKSVSSGRWAILPFEAPVKQFYTVRWPPPGSPPDEIDDYIDDRGRVEVVFANAAFDTSGRMVPLKPEQQTRITLEGDDGLELFYRVGSFEANLARGLAMILLHLVFLAALGLACATFLSFPMACFLSLVVFLAGLMNGFITEALKWSGKTTPGEFDPIAWWGRVSKPLSRAFLWVVPDFSAFDPMASLVDGRAIPWIWLGQAAVSIVLIRTGVVALLGMWIFRRRELATADYS